MKRTLGWVAAAALIAAPAFAGGGAKKEEAKGAQKTEQQAAAADQREISGPVLNVEGNTVFVQHQGAVVALKVDKATKYDGIRGKDDLRHGATIKAKITIDNLTTNQARAISLLQDQGEQGMGGAGEEGTGGAGPEGEIYEEDPSGLPAEGGEIIEEPGTGGAGEEGATDFQTGDVGGKTRGTIPEGEEPGTGSPLPRE